MATIKEIAALAGVSRGTVDRVLNNRGSVNPETEAKIREIAARVNYQPNKAGMMLAAQKKNYKIGVLLFSDSFIFFEAIAAGISAKAQEFSGYNLTLLSRSVPFDEKAQLSAVDALVEEGISGLILAPYNSPRIAERIDSLFEEGIPVVTVNTDIESRRIAYVGCDFYKSGQVAAGLVGRMTKGAQQVGIITGSAHILCHSERIDGFTAQSKKCYPDIHIVDVVENHDDDIESYKLVTAMLKDHPEITTLYFTAGGVSGGCKAVLDLKLDGKLSVFTYDDIPTTAAHVKSGLITATVCQQEFNQGYQAFDCLAKYLFEGKAPENEHLYLDTNIKIAENIE